MKAANIWRTLRAADYSAFFTDESVCESKEENQRDSFRPDILCCQRSGAQAYCPAGFLSGFDPLPTVRQINATPNVTPFLLPYFLALLPPKLRSQWARSDSDATCR